MSSVQNLKRAIWSRYSLWPIFVITEIDNYGNQETFEIDSMNFDSERDDFFITYTSEIFYAAIMNEDEIEVEEQNSITDTSFSEELFPKPGMNHKDRTRVKIEVVVNFKLVEEDPEEDYNDD